MQWWWVSALGQRMTSVETDIFLVGSAPLGRALHLDQATSERPESSEHLSTRLLRGKGEQPRTEGLMYPNLQRMVSCEKKASDHRTELSACCRGVTVQAYFPTWVFWSLDFHLPSPWPALAEREKHKSPEGACSKSSSQSRLFFSFPSD